MCDDVKSIRIQKYIEDIERRQEREHLESECAALSLIGLFPSPRANPPASADEQVKPDNSPQCLR